MYDSIALFGYTVPMPKIDPDEWDIKFQMHLIEMVKEFSHNKRLEDGWSTFPGKSMNYENTDEISKIGSSKPQQAECEELTELDLVKYGWQL